MSLPDLVKINVPPYSLCKGDRLEVFNCFGIEYERNCQVSMVKA